MKLSQKSIQYKILKEIKKNSLICSGEKIVVAVSGGADSVFLFNILSELKSILGVDLSVCHYNHRLRGDDSYNDFEFVQKLASDRGVEFIGGEAKKDNLFKNEEEARNARYQFFKKILQEGRGDKIALGHNLNDQAETFLMRLLRGCGLKGLKSIPYQREKFIRPLLSIPRSEIEEYLKQNQITYRRDLTNDQLICTRNLIRHKILPEFIKANPNFLNTINLTIKSLEEDYGLIEEMTVEAYRRIVIEEEQDKIILHHKRWLALFPALRTATLRMAIENLVGLTDITSVQLDEVKNILLKGEGKKFKLLPHSLRIELNSGNIVMLLGKKTK